MRAPAGKGVATTSRIIAMRRIRTVAGNTVMRATTDIVAAADGAAANIATIGMTARVSDSDFVRFSVPIFRETNRR